MRENLPFDNMDAKLDSPAQRDICKMVGDLPEDTVSMAWRSALNERLVPVAAQRRRAQLLGWFVKPAAGLAMAGALAVAIMIRMAPAPHAVSVAQASGVEDSLIAYHRQAAISFDVAGPGLSNADAQENRAPASTEPNVSEDDLSSL